MTDDSTISGGLSGERRAAIRQRLENGYYVPHPNFAGAVSFEPRRAIYDVRDLLAAVDQITLEREQYRVQVEERYGAVAQWQAEAEINRQAWLKAEAALVVLTQRQERYVTALQKLADPPSGDPCQCEHDTPDCCANVSDYHCPECIAAQALAQDDKDLGLLGSTVPEDAPR